VIRVRGADNGKRVFATNPAFESKRTRSPFLDISSGYAAEDVRDGFRILNSRRRLILSVNTTPYSRPIAASACHDKLP
jgi:hypothetical protein